MFSPPDRRPGFLKRSRHRRRAWFSTGMPLWLKPGNVGK